MVSGHTTLLANRWGQNIALNSSRILENSEDIFKFPLNKHLRNQAYVESRDLEIREIN